MKKTLPACFKSPLLAILLSLFFLKASAYDFTVDKTAVPSATVFNTVQAAINAAPTGRVVPFSIYIKNGKYKEIISIPSNKPFLFLVGESVANTVLTYDNYSGKLIPGGGGTTYGTSNSASVTFNAPDCAAINITFENSTGDAPQALAINVNADRCAFKNCRFLGGQDTVLANGANNRQYFKKCYIDGVVDFIFGSAMAIFDSCVIYPKTRADNLSGSYITAANTPAGQAYGYVFRDCILPANRGITTYVLGRPWQNDGISNPPSNTKVVFINATMSTVVKPQGWDIWSAGTNTSLIYYGEYRSRRFDSSLVDVSSRLPWTYQLSAAQADTYTFANIFGAWNPCAAYPEICAYAPLDLAISNFRGIKGSSTSSFTWNISWAASQVLYEVFRSSDNLSFAKVNEQMATTDSSINYSYVESIPPPGQTYYYFVKASRAGLAAHITDTIAISSTPKITVTGSLGSFVQGVGLASTSQSYIVSGSSLTNNLVITAPAGYELSTNGGGAWSNSGTPVVLVRDALGTVPNTNLSVRLNAASAGTYSGNILHTSAGADTVRLALTGNVQTDPLTVSTILRWWPFTTNNQDSAAVRAAGIIASVPSFSKLVLANGTTVATVPAYSALHGQAFAVTADGLWTTASGGPGGNLNRLFYEQFTVKAGSTHSARVDSLVLSNSFYNTNSNTKLAIVYSKSGFTNGDSTNVSGGIGADGLQLAAAANGAFTTPVLLGNETAGTTLTYRFALAGGSGVNLASGDSLVIRLYYSCGSGSNGRYAKIKNLLIRGLATPNPAIGDYRTHQTGLYSDLSTWERWDGSTWVTPVVAVPVYNNSGTTTLLNGHTVTMAATPSTGSGYVHLLRINAGAQLIVNTGVSLNLAGDGSPSTATTDLQVDGSLTLLGGLFTNGNCSFIINGTFVHSGTGMNFSNAGDSVFVNQGGIYQHNVNSNSTPAAISFRPGSTLNVTGITTNQTDIFKATGTYADIIWNCPGQTNYYAFRNTISKNVSGKFSVVSTGSTNITFANATGRFTFPGGFYQTGGIVNFRENGNITDTLSLGGDFSVTGSAVFNSNATAGSNLLIDLTGTNKSISYSQAGAKLTSWKVSGVYTLADNLQVPDATSGLTVGGTLHMGTNVVSGAGNMLVSAAATVSSAAALGLNGNIAAAGSKILSTNANYIFNGSVAQATGALLPAGVTSLTINNLQGVTLTNTTAISGGTLALTLGRLILGSSNISTASLTGAGAANYVVTNGTGALKINNIGVGTNRFPVGTSATSYNPVVLNNAGTVDNFSVSVKDTFDFTLPDTARVVRKQWNITPDNAAGTPDVTIGLGWQAAAQASAFNPANASSILHYLPSSWTGTAASITGTGTLADPYMATAAGFTTFSPFTVANDIILPLNLLFFNAGDDAGTRKIWWSTSAEINTASFTVERSTDGMFFSSIGTVAAANTGGTHFYSLVDANSLAPLCWYRLRMTDKDGAFRYSRIVLVNSRLKAVFTLYPNPAADRIFITHEKALPGVISVLAADGRVIREQKLVAGAVQSTVELTSLPAGNYFIQVRNATGVEFKAFTKH